MNYACTCKKKVYKLTHAWLLEGPIHPGLIMILIIRKPKKHKHIRNPDVHCT